jgi:hypothetical protein
MVDIKHFEELIRAMTEYTHQENFEPANVAGYGDAKGAADAVTGRTEDTGASTRPPTRGTAKLSDEEERERLRRQVEIILESIDGARTFPPGRPDEMEYLYVEGRILVRDEDLARVGAVVPGTVVDPLINGLSVYAPSGVTTLEALSTLDSVLGPGVATPDHIFYVTPIAGCCPATEPDPAGPLTPYPPLVPTVSGDGAGVVVEVVDTGLIHGLTERHHWLAGVTGDEENYHPAHIGPYVGHGTFVAGVVRGVAPGTHVHVNGFLTHGGAVTESHILVSLYHAVGRVPDVISMSAGCTTRHNLPPIAFEVLWETRLRHAKGTVLVAAAGNNSSRRPFWPAAFEWAVSVGAVAADGTRAHFSDYGSWVDTYALGVDIVNAYPDGRYFYTEPPRLGQVADFDTGLAIWSGTSFSTPMVAGMIAARMSRTGQSGLEAAGSIVRIARRHARAGVGAIAHIATEFDVDPRGY